SLTLNNGQISAETGVTGAETGANIILQNLDLLILENESLISATALEDANGGNISIDSRFVIAMPPEGPNGSDIIAKAFQGNGGRIEIDAISIFGIKERRAISGNQTNDFDASSEFGAPGEVNLNTQFDPSGGLTTLPDEPRDPDVVEGCQASSGEDTVQFYDIGRGGSPPRPDEPLNADTLITEWILLDSEVEDEDGQGEAIAPNTEATRTIQTPITTSSLAPPCQR
ncbi:MAG: S-layer family protein, partial [Symploca sp. SIO2G7]|nr:S-layer family protein [Symploca sp. SIO2G7]